MPCANCNCSGRPSDCTSRVMDGTSVVLRNKGKGNDAETREGERTKLWSTTASTGDGEEGGSRKKKTYGSTEVIQAQTRDEIDDSFMDSDAASTSAVPLAKCEKHNGVRGVCCRDLKRDRGIDHLVNPDVVRDIIIGLSDGLTVPFALTAGLSGVGSTRIVVLAGMAELISGAISMSFGGLLSAQAELQHYQYMQRATLERVAQSCSGLLEKEVCDILEPFGVPSEVGALVAAKLQSVERKEWQDVVSDEDVHSLPAPVSANVPPSPPRRSDGLVGPSRGLTPFLLRMGEGLEKIEASRVWQSALTIGLSYFLGGFIPLLPYILMDSIEKALMVSIIVTGVVLLLFGVVKQVCTGADRDFRGLVYGAISTLAVGATAAGSSFIIVRALEGGSE